MPDQRKLVNHIQQASSKSMVFDHLNTELEQVYILGLVRPPSSNATLNHTVPLDYTWNSSLKVLKYEAKKINHYFSCV